MSVRGPGPTRLLCTVLLAAAAGGAPMQCPSDDRPAMRTEADAAEELYVLAGRLRDRGDLAGWRTTIEYLIERFPDSRWAAAGRVDLAESQP